VSIPRRKAICDVMGKEAVNLWDFQPELEAIKKENQRLKVENYCLSSAQRQFSKTAIPTLLIFLFVMTLFCGGVITHEVWRPSIELAATKKHTNERYENEIETLLIKIDSQNRSIANCDETVADEKEQYDKLEEACVEEVKRLKLESEGLNRQLMMGGSNERN